MVNAMKYRLIVNRKAELLNGKRLQDQVASLREDVNLGCRLIYHRDYADIAPLPRIVHEGPGELEVATMMGSGSEVERYLRRYWLSFRS